MRIKEKSRIICLSVVMIFTLMFININVLYAKSGTSLDKGDYIKFGSYYGEKILWRVIKDDDINKRVMLISDRILTLKAFDASGQNEGKGNNKWDVSNIRDWLNSEKEELSDADWSHGKPIHSSEGNNYADEAGFLFNFLEEERNIIVRMDDNGEQSDNGNKVTLLTEDELSLLSSVGYKDFRAKPTQKAVEESEYETSILKEDKYWWYWTRTPHESNYYSVRDANVDGWVDACYARNGSRGIRPALWLDTSSITLDNASGITETDAYTVTSYVSDTQKPIILNSRVEENILKDSVYGNEQIRSGVVATDDTDGDITSSIVVSGDTVDISKLKDYTIRYNVEDNAGNKATEVTRVVHVLKELPKYDGYEIGTSPEDRKYFKYYMGLDKRGTLKCMMVCADGGNNILKKIFNKEDILDVSTYKFKNCYYIDKEGKIKKYNRK